MVLFSLAQVAKIADKIISLSDRLAAKRPSEKGGYVDNEFFLLDEGLELLASYRAISDGATRQRLRELIDAAARCEVPAAPAEVVRLVASSKPVEWPASPLSKWKTAAVFVALFISASVFLEIVDPAPTDVAAGSMICAPAVKPR